MTEEVALTLDTRGLLCPEPVMMLHEAIKKIEAGQRIKVEATDPSTQRDIARFCEFLRHPLVSSEELNKCSPVEYHFVIQKRKK